MTSFISNENTTNKTKQLPSVKVQLVRNLDFQRQKLVAGGGAKKWFKQTLAIYFFGNVFRDVIHVP